MRREISRFEDRLIIPSTAERGEGKKRPRGESFSRQYRARRGPCATLRCIRNEMARTTKACSVACSRGTLRRPPPRPVTVPYFITEPCPYFLSIVCRSTRRARPPFVPILPLIKTRPIEPLNGHFDDGRLRDRAHCQQL